MVILDFVARNLSNFLFDSGGKNWIHKIWFLLHGYGNWTKIYILLCNLH